MKQTNNNNKRYSTKYGNRYVQQQKLNSCTGNNDSPNTPYSTISFDRPVKNNNEIQ